MISPTCVLCCPHPHPWQPKPQLPAVSQAGACGTEPRSERESGAERGVQRVALHRPPPQFPLPAPPLCRELGGVGVSASFSLPGSEFSERGMRASPGHISHPAELGSGGGGLEAGQPWGLLGLVQLPLQKARVSALLPALGGGAPSSWSPTLPGPAALLILASTPTLCLGWRGELGGSQQDQPPRNAGLLQGVLC